jgi:hypothetical protein
VSETFIKGAHKPFTSALPRCCRFRPPPTPNLQHTNPGIDLLVTALDETSTAPRNAGASLIDCSVDCVGSHNASDPRSLLSIVAFHASPIELHHCSQQATRGQRIIWGAFTIALSIPSLPQETSELLLRSRTSHLDNCAAHEVALSCAFYSLTRLERVAY